MTPAATATHADFDAGVVAGNYYPKYETRNPVARHLVGQFLAAFDELMAASGATDILEVGCGEGFLTTRMAIRHAAAGSPARIRGIDIGAEILTLAASRATAQNVDIDFQHRSVYELTAAGDRADLVVACEMLEHLEDPAAALDAIAGVTGRHAILSVPREPIWRILNMARGKYLGALGNTPGHLQHWSRRGFLAFVERRFDIAALRTPLPWTMVLCRPR